MKNEVEFTVTLKTLTCCQSDCGILFAVPGWWEGKKREDHSIFHCPNGHQQCFSAESDVERAQRIQKAAELRAQAQINEARHAQLVAEKAAKKAILDKRRIERRIKGGVCPCCNRTFEDLQRHMAGKHKDFALPPGRPRLIEAAS